MTRPLALGAGVTVLGLDVAALAVTWVLDLRLIERGYGARAQTVADPEVWVLVVGVLAAGAVGTVIVGQQPRHPVGWLFLGLSSAVVVTALVDQWFLWGVVVDPSEVAGGRVAAVLGDKVWMFWFVLVALALLLTPDGRYPSPRWRWVGRGTLLAGVLAFAASVLGDRRLDPPYDVVENPFAIDALAPAVGPAAVAVFTPLLGIGLVLAGASLVVRHRRATGDDRRALRWLALVAVPLPVFVVAAYVAAYTRSDVLLLVAVGGFVTLVPVAAGLSVLRYRLYDVDRVVATTLTYGLLTTVLVVVYAGVVWAGADLSRGWSPSPAATATVGAVAAALLAAPLRRALQDRIDRRFNRRAYDAVRLVRGGLAVDRAGLDPEPLLRSALDDPAVTVRYPLADGTWASGTGGSGGVAGPTVDVVRDERVVARIGYDPRRSDGATVREVAAVAAAELDNARLRAELARNLADLAESRRRISEAQREERRRIERDLHDGAQQALLALAFELQSAQLNGDPERMRDALSAGAGSARDAARQLRDLANGLHPQALTEGGLSAVLDDLARRSPVPVRVTAPPERFPPATEFTAWLVVAEAVVNAQKHAGATAISVDVHRNGAGLGLRVSDDGRGGADPDSSGLRGLRDRVEAAGGRITIRSDPGAGTVVEGVIPCGS